MSLISVPQGPSGQLQFVPYTVFPNGEMRILSATIHFVGSSSIAYCAARRVKTIRVTSVNDWRSMSWSRFCVVMTLVISWMFIVATGILIHGVGLSSSQNACTSGIYMCIWLYALTKIFIYAFLSEKVRVVWDVVAQPRLKSPVFLICLLVMLPFGAMPIILIVGRIAFFRSDMTCIIGLKPFSSLALLSYDLLTNVFLNAMFLWPLLRSKFINLQLRVVARRTLVAAGAALATSITNVVILTVLKHKLGWVCLASCATDVTLNALVIFWLTVPNVDRFQNEPTNRSVQFIGQQLSSFHQKPDTEYIAHKPASIKAPMVTLSTHATHKPRSSLNTTVFGRAVDAPVSCQSMIAAVHEVQYTPTIPDFPVSPTVASTSVGNLSILAGSPGDGSNSERKSTGLRSLGEFFGLSKQKPEHGMEVHASVATQHDVELGELENVQNKQDDGDSFDQTKSASRCYK
ncbi:unnamed protein product [Rhizoctonia solani]|nr:unnamed protein product [Rhizoctonia solani]